jgi:hypothetical protein
LISVTPTTRKSHVPSPDVASWHISEVAKGSDDVCSWC